MRVNEIVLHALEQEHGQNSSVARVNVTHRVEDNGQLTKGAMLTVYIAVPASHASVICCSSSREIAASWNIRNAREKYNEWRPRLSMHAIWHGSTSKVKICALWKHAEQNGGIYACMSYTRYRIETLLLRLRLWVFSAQKQCRIG